MRGEINVISQEFIKPISPTKNQFRNHQLSFLDQLAPPIFMPFIFFYPKQDASNNTNTNQEHKTRLKKSLSEILTVFYPLAGRIKHEESYIDCNDEGVQFVAAESDFALSETLENPEPEDLNRFLPFESYDTSDVPLVVQLTFFKCGGFALGIGMCHRVCDALSALMFVRSWAAHSAKDCIRNRTKSIPDPSFDSAKLFPPRDTAGLNMGIGIMKENIVTKRFVFPNSSLESLRTRFSPKDIRATRVEALSAFIWSRFMASNSTLPNPNRKIHTLVHPVNLRSRAVPPIPDNVFGNIMRFVVTIPTISSEIVEEQDIVKQIREEIGKVDGGYVERLQEEYDHEEHLEFLKKRASRFVRGEIVSFSFTSLCGFPVYDADFGLGEPAWVASARMGYKNMVAFLDSKKRDGIEAWFNMDVNDMAKLESDSEFLHHVSSDPCVNASAF